MGLASANWEATCRKKKGQRSDPSEKRNSFEMHTRSTRSTRVLNRFGGKRVGSECNPI